MRIPLLTFCLIGLLPAGLVILFGLWGSLWSKHTGRHSYSEQLEIGVLFLRLRIPGTFVASLPYALLGLAGLFLLVFALTRLINPPYLSMAEVDAGLAPEARVDTETNQTGAA